MLSLAVIALLLKPSGSVASLVRNEDGQDGQLKAIVWRDVSLKNVVETRVPVKNANAYRYPTANIGRMLLLGQDLAIQFSGRDGEVGLLVVWKDGKQEFIRTPGWIGELRFIEQGTWVVASMRGAKGQTLSQIYAVKKGLPVLLPWGGDGRMMIRSGPLVLGIRNLKPSRRSFGTVSARSEEVAKSFADLLKSRRQLLSTGIDEMSRQLYVGPSAISPNAKYCFDPSLRTFSGGPKHNVDPYFRADALLSKRGIEWQWKYTIDPFGGFFFDRASRFVFLLNEPAIMGRPGQPRHWPAGLYTLDTVTWKVEKHPLSKRLKWKGKWQGDLVSLHD